MEIDFSCIYHQNRIAIDKCENCGAYICLECKKVERRRHSSINDDNSWNRATYTEHTLCSDCFEKRQKSQKKICFWVCGIVILLTGGLIFIVLRAVRNMPNF